jgi:hypothetical protein
MQSRSRQFYLGSGAALGCLSLVSFLAGASMLGVAMFSSSRSAAVASNDEETTTATAETSADSTAAPAEKPGLLSRFASAARGLVSGGDGRGHMSGGKPVGLYFMTRFLIYNGSLEKVVWYFAPDGRVFRDVRDGFAPEDLAAHTGAHGTYDVNGDALTIHWSDGKETSNKIEPDEKNPDFFAWDTGLFAPVNAFTDSSEVVGSWEGGESLSGGGNFAAVSKTLTLRADGTYSREGVSSFKSVSDQSEVSVGGTSANSGRWELSGYTLTLTQNDGKVIHGIAFPFDDESTAVKPDRFFFGGTMYKKQ